MGWEDVYLNIITSYNFINMLCHSLAGYSLTHASSVVGRDLESKETTAHIASNGVGTNLIASTYTLSTFIYVCEVEVEHMTFGTVHAKMITRIYIYNVYKCFSFESLYLPKGKRYQHPIFNTSYHTISLW